ncbi:serine protease [Alphaproteobacteria bacterium]|nr:serine protease [Alphaproteobacteria bacterium]
MKVETVVNKKKLILFSLLAFLAGCQTDGGLKKLDLKIEKNIKDTAFSISSNVTNSLSNLNPFTKKERDFVSFIEKQEYVKAKKLLEMETVYFQNYFLENDRDPVERLSQYIWTHSYRQNFTDILNALDNCNPLNYENWQNDSNLIRKAVASKEKVLDELAFKIAKNKREELIELNVAINKCRKFYKKNIDKVLTKFSTQLLENLIVEENYAEKITSYDFQSNKKIQSDIIYRMGDGNSESLKKKSKQIELSWLSSETKEALDKRFMEKLLLELKSDGLVSIDDAIMYEKSKGGIYGTSKNDTPLLKLAFLDLDKVSKYPKNSLSFDVEGNLDTNIPVEQISTSYSRDDLLKTYDIIFFKKIIKGDVDRTFNDKSKPSSRFKSGTKQIANPGYPIAFNDYQTALRRQAEVESNSELTNSCRGTAQCIAAGFAQGLAKRKARERAEQAARDLGNTPQTLTEPIFQNYQYRVVEVEAKKTAKVKIGIIDLRDKVIKTRVHDYQDNNKFSIVYGLHENDPDKSDIQRKYDTENDVTSWENKNVGFNLSDLISSTNAETLEISFQNIRDAKFYLESTLINEQITKKINQKDLKNPDVIADERFDSVVLIETGKGLGTGFYVSPDTILTAYHVVEGHSIVKLKKFSQKSGSGRVIDHDIRLDLALIKTSMIGEPAEIYSGPLPLGANVDAIGHPQELEFTITRGVISALRMQESIYVEDAAKVQFVQSDTPISPGNSGGPLFLGKKVVGVADFGLVKKFSQNLNFSVSYNEVNEYLAKNGIF